MAKSSNSKGSSISTVKVEVNKSAINGQFVSDDYAKTHPKTTYTTTVKKPR